MNKLTKQILTGVIALGLLAPVATQAISNNPQTTVQAKSRWRKGTPWVFHKNSYWISNYRKISDSYRNYYVKIFSPLSYKYGYNPTQEIYNKRHHFVTSGADESAFASINPHYRALGHNRYLITSGAGPARKSLYYELHDTLGHDFGSTSLVKVHNRKSVSIWTYGDNGKKYYQGYFHPYTHNNRTLKWALKW